MECSYCGGLVEWVGPLTNPVGTECKFCGAKNSQVPEWPDCYGDADSKTENPPAAQETRSGQTTGYATADAVDLAQWHDVVASSMAVNGVVDKAKLTPKSLAEIYELLPDSLKAVADEWRLSDTVFRDEAYDWLVTHWAKSHNT